VHLGRSRSARLARQAALAALVALASGCVPGPGVLVLRAAEGSVVDRESGAAIAGATVIEWWRGAGRGGGPQPTYHARFATSDPGGRFAFPRELAPSPRLWLLRTYGPSYGFYHADYGLVRGAEPPPGAPVELAGSRAEAELRRADLAPVCAPHPRERWQRELAQVACPVRPRRPD
jgi:hypothetical protein